MQDVHCITPEDIAKFGLAPVMPGQAEADAEPEQAVTATRIEAAPLLKVSEASEDIQGVCCPSSSMACQLDNGSSVCTYRCAHMELCLHMSIVRRSQ